MQCNSYCGKRMPSYQIQHNYSKECYQCLQSNIFSFVCMKLLKIILFFPFLLQLSCSPNKYAVTNKVYKKQAKSFGKLIAQYPLQGQDAKAKDWVGTTNFGLRKPNFVIIHHTAQNSCDQTLQTFTLPRTQVSAHYVICRDGRVYHMLNDYLRAWHAGVGAWGNDQDINSSSIGIELDNNGFEPFPPAQINSLLTVLDTLKSRHRIPIGNFIGHADIAPSRKRDPNINFPWQQLSQKGFGLWPQDTTNMVLPAEFNVLQALRIIGYSTKDSNAAIIAFKRHFLNQDSSNLVTVPEKKIVYSLMLQSLTQ